jgi:hypothetical protein
LLEGRQTLFNADFIDLSSPTKVFTVNSVGNPDTNGRRFASCRNEGDTAESFDRINSFLAKIVNDDSLFVDHEK